MLVMPSDHYTPDKTAFGDMVQLGTALALGGQLVTFGLTPDRMETGFGYMEIVEKPRESCCAVAKFHEKPCHQVA